jgi:inosose dehydratase
MTSRREFMVGAGVAALGAALPVDRLAAAFAPPLYPPVDLSYFDTPITPAPSDIRFGYAAITWGGNDRQAIEDVAAVGFRGIQLRTTVLKEFGDKPAALKELLEQHRLVMTAFSSGNVSIDPAQESKTIDEHMKNAQFVSDVGGMYLQVTDTKPKDRAVTPADCARLGRILTEIAKRTAELGIPLGYHNHMNNIGEKPDDVDRVLTAADPRFVKLELDVAHYLQGGGDPVKAIRQYKDRLLFLHLKDVESPIGSGRSGGSGRETAPSPGPPGQPALPDRSYRFVELGRGKVDLPGVFAALRDVKFRGWAVVELDAVPDNANTPKESALISKKYLEQHGYDVQAVGSY